MLEDPSLPIPLQGSAFQSSDTQDAESISPHRWHVTLRSLAWRPPTDVYETDENIFVRVEIAGMQDKDFAIELNGRMLSIHGVRQDVSERRAFHQMEIRFGEFSIEIELPAPILAQQVEANYNLGFLRITLPKARPLQIEIQEE